MSTLTTRWVERLWQSPWLRGHIGRRMAVLIIAFSSMITLLITVVQLGLEYRELRGGVERQLDDIAVYVDNIAGSVWAFDENQIKSALEGIKRLQNIEVASIELLESSSTWSTGMLESKSFLSRIYVLKAPQRDEQIGSLTVVASLDEVNERIYSHAVTILLSNFFKTLCVALFMLFLFRHMVTRRLLDVSNKVRRLGPELFPSEALITDQVTVVPADLDELAAVEWVLDRTAEALKRAAEEQLAAEQQNLDLTVRLQAMLDAAVEFSIISTDVNGAITVFNRGAERMLGYSAEEMIGQTPSVFHRDSEVKLRGRDLSKQLGRPIAGFETFVAAAREGGSETRNWTYVRKDGVNLRVSLAVTAVYGAKGDLIGFLGIARDVSQQLAAEADLLKLNLQLENRVRERTEALQASTDLLQRTLDDLRQTQGQLVQAEKLASLGSLVAAMAHELNTPIGICLTTATALHDKTEDFQIEIASGPVRKAQLNDYLSVNRDGSALLTRGLERCAALVANFKQVAANARGMTRTRFMLDSLLEFQCSLLRSNIAGGQFLLEYECPEALWVETYADALEQIITHVVTNAVIHGYAGRQTGSIKIAVTCAGDSLQMDFQDKGCGMTEEARRHVFDPFFTTQLGKGGSGLGLYICYNLATGPLGGTLSVTSTPGMGSVFTMKMPLNAPAPGETQQ